MAEITLKGKSEEINVLTVKIGKKSYNVPLSGSLSIKEMRAMSKGSEDGFDFFGKYIPEEVLDELTMDEFKQLSEAWKSASAEAAGVDVGES